MDRLLEFLPSLASSGARIGHESSIIGESHDLYHLSFDLDSPSDANNDSLVSSFNLGRKGNHVTGALRLTRDKCYWLFAHQNLVLPSHTDTQLLALRGPQHVLVLLPLTTSSCMGTFRGPLFEPEKDLIFARFERSHPKSETGVIVGAIAGDINTATRAAVQRARLALNVPTHIPNGPPPGSHIFDNILTYCTWNSLQPPTPTTAASALKALEHFHSIGARPAAFLIDDAWQDVKSFRLQTFGSAPSFLDGFEGLGAVVKAAKERFGVENVGVWHTIQGYWQGVEPSKFAGRYKLIKVTKDGYPGPAEEEGFQYHIPHPDAVQSFFNDYYATLHSAGVTFAKCDNMASIDHIATAVEATFTEKGEEVLGEAVDLVTLRMAYVQAVMNAARQYFGNENVIWCMGMTPRVLLGGIGLGGKGAKRVVRNSDDYYPNEPDSHRYHIFTNTINALLLNELDVQPDLDMFQTHPYISPTGELFDTPAGLAQARRMARMATFHASFRVFGTGPVTITDVPFRTNPDIMRKIVGNSTPDAKSPSVVIQASSPFRVPDDTFDPRILEPGVGRALKIYGDRAIGVWNIQSGDGNVIDFISPSDITQALRAPSGTLPPTILCIQSSNPANERTILHNPVGLHPPRPIRIELGPLGWATISTAPVTALLPGGMVACPGLVDKYLPSQGILESELIKLDNDHYTYAVASKSSGTLGVWASSKVVIGGVQVEYLAGDTRNALQETSFEAVELEEGRLITLQLMGKSKVTFQLENRGS